MSTGAECRIIETKPGVWMYKLQEWPYGDWPEYSEHGPFGSMKEAQQHLRDNHANPGGYSVIPYKAA